MFRSIKTPAVLCACLMLLACGTEDKDKNAEADGLFEISLSRFGKPFTIRVPDTSQVHLNIEETSEGALNVRSGPSFGLSIYEENTNLDLKRSDIKSDEVNKLKAFTIDEPDAIVWESAITDDESHFVLNKNIGGTDYSFQDIPGVRFSAGAISTMYKSAREAKQPER